MSESFDPTVTEKEPCLPLGLCSSILLEVMPLTGEPDTGNPHVRFGGRGGRTQSAFPIPLLCHSLYNATLSSRKFRFPPGLPLQSDRAVVRYAGRHPALAQRAGDLSGQPVSWSTDFNTAPVGTQLPVFPSITATLRRNPQVHWQPEQLDPILPSCNSTCHLPVVAKENEAKQFPCDRPCFRHLTHAPDRSTDRGC